MVYKAAEWHFVLLSVLDVPTIHLAILITAKSLAVIADVGHHVFPILMHSLCLLHRCWLKHGRWQGEGRNINSLNTITTPKFHLELLPKLDFSKNYDRIIFINNVCWRFALQTFTACHTKYSCVIMKLGH